MFLHFYLYYTQQNEFIFDNIKPHERLFFKINLSKHGRKSNKKNPKISIQEPIQSIFEQDIPIHPPKKENTKKNHITTCHFVSL